MVSERLKVTFLQPYRPKASLFEGVEKTVHSREKLGRESVSEPKRDVRVCHVHDTSSGEEEPSPLVKHEVESILAKREETHFSQPDDRAEEEM